MGESELALMEEMIGAMREATGNVVTETETGLLPNIGPKETDPNIADGLQRLPVDTKYLDDLEKRVAVVVKQKQAEDQVGQVASTVLTTMFQMLRLVV